MAAVIFDLDGTLIDSAPDIHAGANAVLADEGYAPLSFEEACSFIGEGAAVFVEKMRAARGIEAAAQERLLAKFMAHYQETPQLTSLYPSVMEMLGALRRAGHRLGICTNKPIGPTRIVLGHFALSSFFDAIYGGDSLAERKPHPLPLRACLDDLGGGPALYVGDSEVDANTALRAHIPFALFTLGYRKSPIEAVPHLYAFDQYDKFPEIVARHFIDTNTLPS